ncbi:MAG: carboxypeptidase regulatory-like domain-containing protein [Gemmatimonadota bacterium]|nr:carboxypeptidase regulatory-like domain-containing protein [Gemmatimonadota bacterium]
MRVALGIVLALTAFGCGGDNGGDQAADQPAAGQEGAGAVAPAGGGTITGTVSFTGTPPANPTIDMSEEPACAQKHAGGARDPQVVVTDGKLANVFVFVKSGLPAGQTYPVPSSAAVLDQDGCLYEPRNFGVMVGQTLEIKNSDPVLHNIKAVPTKNRGFNISQPTEGMTTRRTFNTEEIAVPLECNVHGWMHASVTVLDHPFFASTGNDGTFTIRGLPAGTYEIEARHEKLGTRTQSVTVPEDGTATADITFGAAAS